MRYSPENTALIGRPAEVYLDGKEVKGCIEADDVEGFVRVLRVDSRGQVILLPDHSIDDAVYEGKVEVRFRDECRDPVNPRVR